VRKSETESSFCRASISAHSWIGTDLLRRKNRGAAVLVAAIVIGNLNIVFLLVFAATNPNPGKAWAYWIPRVGYDVMSIWSVVFWTWAVVDAYQSAKKKHQDNAEG
jgi:hypothetical protein